MLTMLGIIIGVGAVITMLAAGTGAQRRIDEQIAALGTNMLNINASRSFVRGVARNQLTLDVEDAYALQRDARHLEIVVPKVGGRGQLKIGNSNTNVRLTGTNAWFAPLFRIELSHGRFFSDAEDQSLSRVVVLGSDIPNDLDMEGEQLIGQTIALNGQPFRVIGILSEAARSDDNLNSTAIVPIRTGGERILGQRDLEDISVRVKDGIALERAMVDIERVLRHEHRLMPGQPNNFSIFDQREFMETQAQAQQTFTALLASIAGVSLLVGGIGIMNIMLVSVTERTREIGIRKALGATRFTVLAQFLVESMSLCLLGGVLGVAAGTGAAKLLSHYFGWETLVSMESVLMSSLFAGAVGLVFGILPARRAARLDPIEALRYE
jgi:putative ABC transport system permease protein